MRRRASGINGGLVQVHTAPRPAPRCPRPAPRRPGREATGRLGARAAVARIEECADVRAFDGDERWPRIQLLSPRARSRTT